MSHRTFLLPDEVGAIINEYSKPVTRPSWKTTVTPSALALKTNCVYVHYIHDTDNGNFNGNFWWWCRHICLIYPKGTGR